MGLTAALVMRSGSLFDREGSARRRRVVTVQEAGNVPSITADLWERAFPTTAPSLGEKEPRLFNQPDVAGPWRYWL